MSQKFARRSILGYGLGGASVALLGLTTRSQAAATTYKATLNATSEVPPNQSPATGTATVTYDDSTKTVTWEGTFTGLSGPATAAHIHGPAEAGKNAGVIVPMSQAGTPFTSPFKGSMQLADDKAGALASALTAGQAYVNVHTDANKGGEIRGQLAKS
jgi:Cu/Zn superoxide dismutase